MLSTQRRGRIVAHLRKGGAAAVEELAEVTGSSVSTVRRDLLALQSEGVLRRVHGGAVLTDGDGDGDTGGDGGVAAPERTAAERADENVDQKRRIAAAAAARLRPDATVLVSGGSTTEQLVPHLRDVPGLTVVTNSVAVAYRLGTTSSVPVIVLGGYLRAGEMSLLGMRAVQAMSDLHIDTAFAGAYGLDPEVGALGANVAEADTDRALLAQVGELVVLADASKF
ncbi:MAG TPA: DeoR/GlpR family DNA-binding transcription regulator, partial [Pseudonocardia sp.]|nr:DeoR/GlpR family DNA-binding transcription regulator [Pseudonocardia sp.]